MQFHNFHERQVSPCLNAYTLRYWFSHQRRTETPISSEHWKKERLERFGALTRRIHRRNLISSFIAFVSYDFHHSSKNTNKIPSSVNVLAAGGECMYSAK